MSAGSTLNMDRSAWLAARRRGIGGSDAATVCGLNPYATPRDLYAEKRGEAEPASLADNEAVRFGTLLEPVVADEYERRTGRVVHRVNRILAHREHEWMLGNIDRRVVGESRGLEIKTAGTFAARFDEWGETGTDQVPTRYLLQVAHYLALTGWDAWDLAVLVGGNDLRIYTIERDETLIANLTAIEAEFWDRVQRGDPPPVTTYAEAARVFPRHTERAVEATPEIANDVARYRELQAREREIAAEIDGARKAGVVGLKARIAAYLGDADTLTIGGTPALTWRAQSARRLDADALRAAHPDLYAQFTRETSSRVLRLKGVSA